MKINTQQLSALGDAMAAQASRTLAEKWQQQATAAGADSDTIREGHTRLTAIAEACFQHGLAQHDAIWQIFEVSQRLGYRPSEFQTAVRQSGFSNQRIPVRIRTENLVLSLQSQASRMTLLQP